MKGCWQLLGSSRRQSIALATMRVRVFLVGNWKMWQKATETFGIKGSTGSRSILKCVQPLLRPRERGKQEERSS